MPRWYLHSSEINGGFLPGVSVQFPRGLTCIIGARGSGKSTLIEALRFGLAGANGATKPRLDLIQANLGTQSLITLRTSSENGEPAYIIRRSYKQPASLVGSDGSIITTVDLDRGTFLPLDAYSADEIEEIAKESIGDKRRTLLDELRGEELSQIQLKVAEHRRALSGNADAIRTTQELIKDLTEEIADMGDARARLAALPPASKDSECQGLVTAARQSQLNSQESLNLSQFAESVSNCEREVQKLADKLSATELESPEPESVNHALLTEVQNEARQHLEIASRDLNSAADAIQDVLRLLSLRQQELASVHSEQEAAFVKLKEQNAMAGRAIQERASAETSVSKLAALEGRKSRAATELLSLYEARKALKGDYLLERERISELRETVAAQLQCETGNNVRIRIRRNADNLNYQQMLSDALHGARVRNQEEIVKRLMRLRPEQLAQYMSENRPQEFEKQMSLGDERSQKVLDSLREHIDPLDLEIVTIDDRIYIELNVGTTAEPNFKDASELSRGQKCTALLPLLLARRDSPLVVDQPEDNLDNHFIYETVVETIRRMKNRRQMVFVTHNANIPVLGEAELVVVLNSDGKIGYVEKAGTLDECREEIIDLLEGGREAFELRRQRYAKPQ